MNKFKIKNYGFTLAEVLITLGVVGVVAAMTLPTLIKNYQKHQTINQLKKVYTIINQAIKLSETQNSEFIYWDDPQSIGAKEYFNKYYKPYMETVKICKNYSECGYQVKEPWFKPKGNTISIYSLVYSNAKIPFVLKDGTFILLVIESSGIKNNNIWVDINGSKGPNRLGHDFFMFERTENGMIKPLGYNKGKNNIDINCKSSGEYCAAKIIQDGWKIEKNYPW